MINNREAFAKLLSAIDSGGATNHGITVEMLSDWRKKPVTDGDVRNLSLTDAQEIIWLRYWNPIRANDLVGGIDVYLCDFAIASTVRRAVRTLQILLGFTGKDVDGIVGPLTLQKVSEYKPKTLLMELHNARMVFLRNSKNQQGELLWTTFGKDWTKRCNDVLLFASDFVPAEAPAVVAKLDKLKRNLATLAATAGAAIPAVISVMPAAKEAYGQAQDTLGPFAEVAPWLPLAGGGLVMLGVVWLAVRNATMAHNAKVTGSQAAVVAESRIPQEAAT